MRGYTHKDAVSLAYDANKKRLRTEGSIVLAEVMNAALTEMTDQFNEALNRGEVLEIGGSRDEMKALLLAAARKQLRA